MKTSLQRKSCVPAMARAAGLASMVALLLPLVSSVRAADGEYTGKLDPQLRVNREGREQVIFRPVKDLSKIKTAKPIEKDSTVTAGRLYHVLSDKSSILTLLVDPEDESPYLYADVDLNNQFDESERFELKQPEEGSRYIWETSVNQPLKEGPFKSFPLFVQYFKNARMDGMEEEDCLVVESREAFAAGFVDIQGKKTLVQYSYNPRSNKISVTNGKLGVDADGNGEIDFEPFSPEAAETQEEAVIFRAGNNYVSTKKVDLEKNLIIMKSHSASDYKRIEVGVGLEMPDFEFTDFNGKKRKLSEYRGKHVLLDFWGMWCPPCRQELPYLKAAYSRFQARGFEIIGLNTDQPEITSALKTTLEKNGMTWAQAKLESIARIIRNLRINSYPTTMLIGPDGKILSLNNTSKGEPDLRGNGLLKSLDKILPR